MIQEGLTIEDLLIRLAETIGVSEPASDGTPGLPSDTVLLTRLKKCITDGIGLMQLANSKWRVLRPVVEVQLGTDSPACIDGDPTKYALPWYVVAQPGGGWQFVLEGSWSGPVVSTTFHRIAELNATDLTGPPRAVAMVPGARPGEWEIRLAPAPDAAYVLRAQCSLLAFKPTQLYQRSPFGAAHDQTVLAAAKWCYVRDEAADSRKADFQAEFDSLLAASIKFDIEAAGAITVGKIIDPSMRQSGQSMYRRHTPVTHENSDL